VIEKEGILGFDWKGAILALGRCRPSKFCGIILVIKGIFPISLFYISWFLSTGIRALLIRDKKHKIKMESSLRTEGTFDILREALKVIRDWRRELKELRLAIPIFEGRDVAGWMIKMGKYFDAGGVCKEYQIPEVVKWMNG
jgi:hypothetical protein